MSNVLILNNSFIGKGFKKLDNKANLDLVVDKLLSFDGIKCFYDFTNKANLIFDSTGKVIGIHDISHNGLSLELKTKNGFLPEDLPIYDEEYINENKGCVLFPNSEKAWFHNEVLNTGLGKITVAGMFKSTKPIPSSQVIFEVVKTNGGSNAGNLYYSTTSSDVRALSGGFITRAPYSPSINFVPSLLSVDFNKLDKAVLIAGNGFSSAGYTGTITDPNHYLPAGGVNIPGNASNSYIVGYIPYIIVYDNDLGEDKDFLATLYQFNDLILS